MSLPSEACWTFKIPETIEQEIHALNVVIERFIAGRISDAEFRAIRVPMGIYEQRESGRYMLRVRFPAGGLRAVHLRRLAEVSADFGNGILHFTTRQEAQIHRVPVDSIYPALLSLWDAGLSTKGGGGNTVRNITACARSGVCAEEAFDVGPCALAMTERLLPDRLSFELPRKFKIAFSGCARDCAGAAIHDLGFIARGQNGQNGFSVYVGGGLGAKSRVADLFEDFIPAAEAFLAVEAVKRVFDKHGDRKNKHRARLRFLVERIGLENFRNLYESELRALRAAEPIPAAAHSAGPNGAPPFTGGMRESDRAEKTFAAPNSCKTGNGTPNGSAGGESAPASYRLWRAANVVPQKQAGFYEIEIPLALGDLAADDAMALAELIENRGERAARATQRQTLLLRWIAESELSEIYRAFDALGLADPQAPVLRNLVACAGASTCRLGICLSRGLSQAVQQALRTSGLDLNQLGPLRIHISGCPNSCGRHPVADIGFSGAARRVGERMAPHYTVHLGGQLENGARLGQPSGTIPAQRAPEFLVDLLREFLRSGVAPSFHDFLAGDGRKIASDLVAQRQQIPAFEDDPSFYCDWGSDKPFSLAGRGSGECSAGLFDLIKVDLDSARDALRAGRHYHACASAARALLVTCGSHPKNDADSFVQFRKHFVAKSLVEPALDAIIAAALSSAAGPAPERTFQQGPDAVAQLIEAVAALYEKMDPSLRIPAAPADLSKPEVGCG